MTHRRGFTLIELLVVISIIALLISILLPSLGAAKESAKDVLCQGREKQLFTASAIYEQDYRMHIQGTPRSNGDKANVYWDDGGSWHRQMVETIMDVDVPETADRWGDVYPGYIATNLVLYCAKTVPDDVDGASLGPVSKEGNSGSWQPERPESPNWSPTLTEQFAVSLSRVLYAGDTNGWGIRSGSYQGPFSNPMFRHRSSYGTPEGQRESSGGSPRGDGTANLVFLDGSVQRFTESEYNAAVSAGDIVRPR